MTKILLSISLLFLTLPSFGYIPPTKYIAQRTVGNHGRGYYKLKSQIRFDLGQESVTMTETWTVGHGELMLLEASGGGNHVTILYKDGIRYFKNPDNNIKSLPFSKEFFEPYFHVRSTNSFIDMIVRDEMAPRSILEKKSSLKSLSDLQYNPETYVRLTRTGGRVNYTIGKISPVGSAEAFPALWVEQDQFHVLRIRYKTQAEVLASGFLKLSRGLQFPKLRTVNFDSQSLQIQTMRVDGLPSNNQTKQLFDTKIFKTKKASAMTWTESPIGEKVKQFYTRFR